MSEQETAMTATTDQSAERPPAPRSEAGEEATSTNDYPIDDLDDDLDIPARRRRLGGLTMVLILLLVAGLGVYGGVRLQKSRSSSSSTSASALASAFASRFAGARAGGTGSGGGLGAFGGGAGAGSTTGTVKLVDGNTIYLSQADGSIVKVTTTPAGTTVTKTVPSSVGAIQPGETLVVQGATGSDGTVSATRVTDAGATAAASTGTGAPGTGG
jgi:hypothetical protein